MGAMRILFQVIAVATQPPEDVDMRNGTRLGFPPPPAAPRPMPPPPEPQIREEWLALLAYTGLGFSGALAALITFLCACFAARRYWVRRSDAPTTDDSTDEQIPRALVATPTPAAWPQSSVPRTAITIKLLVRDGIIVQQPGTEDSQSLMYDPEGVTWVALRPSLDYQEPNQPSSPTDRPLSRHPSAGPSVGISNEQATQAVAGRVHSRLSGEQADVVTTTSQTANERAAGPSSGHTTTDMVIELTEMTGTDATVADQRAGEERLAVGVIRPAGPVAEAHEGGDGNHLMLTWRSHSVQHDVEDVESVVHGIPMQSTHRSMNRAIEGIGLQHTSHRHTNTSSSRSRRPLHVMLEDA